MAGAKGDPSADSAASALASALSIEESSAAAPPGAILQAAAFWTQAGSPGRALDLIEHAMAARADEPELASRLAEIRRFYGLD
jgi:hypothetical protein